MTVDAAGIEYCDGAGIALLVDLVAHPRAAPVEVANLRPDHDVLFRQFDPERLEHDLDPEPKRAPVVEEIGRTAAGIWRDIRNQVEFIGEMVAALGNAIVRPAVVRWRDVWRISERVGADGLPIVALISFLMGLILAFQSAVPMRRFGAEIFVADLVGIAMVRELGPLMTAILLAGRTGAAFAAEIGTMHVNQEVDALTTMGLDPVRFLVVPRIIAALLMTPLLTLFAMLVGLAGGALTMQSFAIPLVTFLKEVDSAVTPTDFMAGFVKSFVFAILIAGVGCLRGLETAAGASAVGDSRDARRRFGHHPARRRRRDLRGHLLHARHLMAAREPVIRVENLTAGYDETVILRGLNFVVQPGEVFVILGGSGCGKSTLLKHMISLYPPLEGRVLITGRDITAADGDERREIMRGFGVMYQSGALFGSMTLLENVRLPLEEYTDLPMAAMDLIARMKLELVGLDAFTGHLPNEISGGMQKRAAIARAMALDPGILFLDEPSAGLDPITSAEIDALIRRLQRTLGVTFVVVTHELPSIFAIADRVIMLDKRTQGIIAEGDPKVLRDTSDNPWVRQFFRREAELAETPA